MNFITKFKSQFETYITNKLRGGNTDITIKVGKSAIVVGHDSKLLSKIYENYTIGILKKFCKEHNLKYKENNVQNRYPDFVLYTPTHKPVAIDIKTSYLKSKTFINGFTLGTYRGYFSNQHHSKNTMYPYSHFASHLCICLIYSREKSNVKLKHALVREKWRIASRSVGSGNTCNIGSIKHLRDILNECGVFRNKKEFETFWIKK